MTQYTKISKYYPSFDGTRIAVDLYRPLTEEKVPLIMNPGREFRHLRFERRKYFTEQLLNRGYAVAFMENRGIGASYGTNEGFIDREAGKDNIFILNTLAEEDWCNGKVGIYGASNNGFMVDLMTSHASEHLISAISADDNLDFYYQLYPNGASRHIVSRSRGIKPPMSLPVDEDKDGSMLEEAYRIHDGNMELMDQYWPNMYRDDYNEKIGYRPNLELSIYNHIDRVKQGHVMHYKNAAWYDPSATNAIILANYLKCPLVIGPWAHCGMFMSIDYPGADEKRKHEVPLPNNSFDWISDYLNFFDATLKGVENGYFDRPRIIYYVRGEEEGKEWHSTDQFPLKDSVEKKLYLNDAHSGTIDSVYDGSLSENVSDGQLSYVRDKSVVLYTERKNMNRFIEGKFREESKKCLTFTSAPLTEDTEITGIPVMNLSVTSDCKDGLFFAVLEEVYPDETTCFLSEGQIKGSHAKLAHDPVYDSYGNGLPFHRSYREDAVELHEEMPTDLAFYMEAFSKILKKGSRLRVSVFTHEKIYQEPDACKDMDPTIQLHLNNCWITLPFIAKKQ